MTITLENLLNKLFKSSRPEVFSKKCVLENFAKFHRKTLVPECFLKNKLRAQACNFIKKRVSGTGVFLWIFRNFQEHHFYWTPLDDCFRLFQNPFSWLLVYHFTTLLETWMFIQCSRDFRLWTVAKYNSDWVCFKHIICFVII